SLRHHPGLLHGLLGRPPRLNPPRFCRRTSKAHLMRRVACFAAAIWCLVLGAAWDVAAAEIRILSGSAIETAMAELIPKFEQSSGHKVTFDFNGAIGAMTDRIERGEAADVVIVSGPQIEKLQQQRKVLFDSRADIARVGIGVF